MHSTICSNKWVCPSDRHLLLRAKLNSGWSVRSTSSDSLCDSNRLSSDEMQQIKQVITRANRVDENEQKRIGLMVHHLENIRMRACGNGNENCILCAEEFGRLVGASSILCADCRKRVCSKCTVDSMAQHTHLAASKCKATTPQWLCKICCESRLLWKQSGAWFFKGLPRYILPESKSDATTNPFSNHLILTPVSCHNIQSLDSQVAAALHKQRKSIAVGRRKSSSSESSGLDVPGSLFSPSYADDDCQHSFINPSQQSISNVSDDQGDVVFNLRSSGNNDFVAANESEMQDVSQYVGEGNPGSLEFVLFYDASKLQLHVTIIRAEIGKVWDNSCDAYVKSHLLPLSRKSTKKRTKTKRKTNHPEFNESLTYGGITENDLPNKSLRLQVCDVDRFRHSNVIGEVIVPLRHLTSEQQKNFKLKLTKQHSIS